MRRQTKIGDMPMTGLFIVSFIVFVHIRLYVADTSSPTHYLARVSRTPVIFNYLTL